MIAVKRTKAPKFLTDKKGKWFKETADAIAHYSKMNPPPFEFKMYNDTQLKDALKKIFVKCAYCETIYGASYDGDVEHFRPKGQVSEKNPKNPGYYWLANDWHNLLLSCQHCNQRRKHKIFGETTLTSYGKLDQFPLDDESKRIITKGSLAKEEKVRLLINPCLDNPEEHFEYDITEAVIKPLTKQGTASVKVYVLQRQLLVQGRKMQLDILLMQMSTVKRDLDRYNKSKTAVNKADFKTSLKDLINLTTAEKPYAGMCRYFVKKFLNDNGIK